jgi:hypothetical protein
MARRAATGSLTRAEQEQLFKLHEKMAANMVKSVNERALEGPSGSHSGGNGTNPNVDPKSEEK